MKRIVAAIFLALTASASAHRAPSGWSYDYECCANHDCMPVSPLTVTRLRDGFLVRIMPGDHPLATKPMERMFKHGEARESGDKEFHVCVSKSLQIILCVYVPFKPTEV